MANLLFTSEVNWSGEGVLSVASSNGKQYIIDEPPALGGTDKGPNPVEYILGALGGCINVLIVSFAPQHDVEIKGINVHVEGDLDPDGFLGKNENVRAGFQEIRYRVDLESSSPQENIEKLLAHVDNVCPVKDTLQGVVVKRVD